MSITKVAELAGVSIATVSRVINRQGVVAPETEMRIRACMQSLGYVPRAHRPGPKRAEHRAITRGTVVLLSLMAQAPGEMYRQPALPALLGGVQAALNEHGLNLLLAHSPDGIAVPPALANGKADGVLVVGRASLLARNLLARLAEVPVVWMMREHNDEAGQFDHVFYDNRLVGPLAARYFHARGHQRVGFISTDPTHTAYAARRDLFVSTARELGLVVDVYEAAELLDGGLQVPFIDEVVTRLMAQAERPTALFCAADDRMLTVYYVLQRRGLSLVTDIELLGCNNEPAFLRQMHPRPATIDIKLELVGRKAAELLWQRLGESQRDSHVEMLIKPSLVTGEVFEVPAAVLDQ